MRYLRALTLSLMIHIAVLVIAWIFTPAYSPIPRQLTVVDLLEEPELPRRPKQPPANMKQFVRKAEIPEELKTDKDKESQFASEDEQNVLEQTRARDSGMTANRSSEGRNEIPSRSNQKRSVTKRSDKLDLKPQSPLERLEELAREPERTDEGDVAVGERTEGRKPAGESSDGSRPLVVPNFGLDRGVSTVGESLPDSIKFGDFTVLNTDRHLFYAFYARIEEGIRNRWVSYARAVLLSQGASRLPPGETWTTKLEVILDEKGNFKRAILAESSGIKGLDSAPVQAFRDAQQFPNPPPEMVKDGEIHVYYAFAVNVIPSYAQGE